MDKKKKLPARPSYWKVWWVASRPHTLTASLAPVIVSFFAGLSKIEDLDSQHYLWLTIQWACFCMMMQLGTNLHNDYADFVKGADTDKRVGQARATQKGWLTPMQTALAARLVLGMGLLLGVQFIASIKGAPQTYSMIFIVSTSIFNAFAYTGGPWPLGYIGLGNFSIGYSGLGDLFVFLYFGLVATLTLPFLYISTVQTDQDLGELLWILVPYSVQVAALATNIIVVNNLRDRHTDVVANKRTLAVRFGARFCKIEFILMIVMAYGLVFVEWILNGFAIVRLLPLLSFPVALSEIKAIHTKEGRALNPHVGGSAKVQLLFCILLSIAIRIS